MKVKHSDKRILYLHLPKCAGTSIESSLGYTSQYENGSWRDNILPSIENYKAVDYDYRFTVVRNPYDRLVSFYHWIHTTSDNIKRHFTEPLKYKRFQDWVVGGAKITKKLDFRWVCMHDKLDKTVDIFRYESLEKDWHKILSLCGIPKHLHYTFRLKHINKSTHSNYKEYYDSILVKTAAERYFKTDLKVFNYKL